MDLLPTESTSKGLTGPSGGAEVLLRASTVLTEEYFSHKQEALGGLSFAFQLKRVGEPPEKTLAKEVDWGEAFVSLSNCQESSPKILPWWASL